MADMFLIGNNKTCQLCNGKTGEIVDIGANRMFQKCKRCKGFGFVSMKPEEIIQKTINENNKLKVKKNVAIVKQGDVNRKSGR